MSDQTFVVRDDHWTVNEAVAETLERAAQYLRSGERVPNVFAGLAPGEPDTYPARHGALSLVEAAASHLRRVVLERDDDDRPSGGPSWL